MEIFGMILSIPAAFVASSVYCLILVKVIRKHERVGRWLWWGSVGVVGLFAAEAVLIATMGTVGSRELVGPGFYLVHLIVFLLGTPAVANLMLLRRRTALLSWSIGAVLLCTVVAFEAENSSNGVVVEVLKRM